MFSPRSSEAHNKLSCAVGNNCLSTEYKQAIKSRAKALIVFEKELAGLKPDEKLFLCRHHYAMLGKFTLTFLTVTDTPPTSVRSPTHTYEDIPPKVVKILEKQLQLDTDTIKANAHLLWRIVRTSTISVLR